MTTTDGIEAVFLETHNWGKAAKFFQALGFELEFDTDHNSGQLRNGDGPYVFIAEVPEDQAPGMQLVLKVADADALRARPVVEVVTPFEDTHYGTREMTVRDPDGRVWSLQGPPSEPPAEHVMTADARRARQHRRAGRALAGACTSRSTRRRTCSRTSSACSWPRPTTTGATGPTCTRRAPAGSGPRSWPAPASSRTSSPSRPPPASTSTSSSAPASTPSPSAGPTSATACRIFEVDQPGTQAWKRRRLVELGFGVPDWLRLVPIDFETGESWWDGLAAAGFDPSRPAVVASTGVSMYLTKERHRRHAAPARRARAGLDGGDDVPAAGRARRRGRPARARGQHPRRQQLAARRSSASTRPTRCWPWPATPASATSGTSRPASLADRYFAGRADGLRPSTGEDILVATT